MNEFFKFVGNVFRQINEEHFEIKTLTKDEKNEPINVSFVPSEDAQVDTVVADSFIMGSAFVNGNEDDLERLKSEKLISYREISLHPLVSKAITQNVTEAICERDGKSDVEIKLDELVGQISAKRIKDIEKAFKKVLKKLKYKRNATDIFRKFYTDGTLPYHIIVREGSKGIDELRYVDPLYLTRVKRANKRKEIDGHEYVTDYEIVYKYQPKDVFNQYLHDTALEIHHTAIIYATSGLLDASRRLSISYLDKAIRPHNMLVQAENSHMIYRITRAYEKLIFYVDVGIDNQKKASRKMEEVASQFKYNINFDPVTGKFNDMKSIHNVVQDMWIPRMEGKKTTEIDRLDGASNLNDINDIKQVHEENLFKALDTPLSRLNQANPFSSGRSMEISRDEVIFQKHVDGIRRRLASQLFLPAIRIELILNGSMKGYEFDDISDDINFVFPVDNQFAKLLEFEILKEKLNIIQMTGHDPRIFFGVDDVGAIVCGYSKDEMVEKRANFANDLSVQTHNDIEQEALAQDLADEYGLIPDEPQNQTNQYDKKT